MKSSQTPVVEHRTIKIKKTMKAPLVKVFKALSSTKEKKIWSAPKGDEIRFSKENFKVGGVESFKCGSIGSLDYKGIVQYLDIVKNQRIVYLETVFYQGNKLASAIVTTELKENKNTTSITMTVQVASYCGERMLKGCETGYKSSMANLSEYFLTTTSG